MPPVDRNNPKRAVSSDSQVSILEFHKRFPDDATCLEYLWRNRFSADGEHAHCPKCEEIRSFKKYEIKNRGTSWTCTACGWHIHPLAGTIYHKSSTALHLWFYAMFLMTSTRCGISAKQLERELGVTYKTAWRIFTLIRNQLMPQDDVVLTGQVEADETYVGGRPHGAPHLQGGKGKGHHRGGRTRDQKVPVFGMVERSGRVRAYPVANVSSVNLVGGIRKHVEQASIVYTDTFPAYRAMKHEMFDHRQIQHNLGIYVSGDIHTQTIEGFWSLVKRGISGTHHQVSKKYLQGYLNEYVWRYNHRDDPRSMFELLLLRSAHPVA